MEPKSLPALFAEWWDLRHRARAVQDAPARVPRTSRWIPSPGTVLFTSVIMVGLLWAQSVGAIPLFAPSGNTATSTGTIAYQGRLADPDGTPLTGTYSMIFRLYAAATGGTPLWEETWTGPSGVAVSDGLFNVMLGSLEAIPTDVVTGHDNLWLGITVGTDDEMLPRVQLGNVPWAVQALTVPDGSITTAKIADAAVTTTKLASPDTGPIREWNLLPGQVFSASGAHATRMTFDTGIDVTVAPGAHNRVLVVYRGLFNYEYAHRTDSSLAFYGDWTARLVDGDTVLGEAPIVHTGYQSRWDSVGGNWYWVAPYSATWLVDLGSGTHSLDIALYGYSSGSMNYGAVVDQHLQAVLIP